MMSKQKSKPTGIGAGLPERDAAGTFCWERTIPVGEDAFTTYHARANDDPQTVAILDELVLAVLRSMKAEPEA